MQTTPRSRATIVALIVGVAWLWCQAATASSDPRVSDWPVIGGNSNVWQFSQLTQINVSNVKDLGVGWMADIPSRDGLVGNPLVADGVVFQSGPLGRIYANDVRTGKLLWRFAPEIKFDEKMAFPGWWSLRYNRGVALLGENAYVASGDCRIFAVNRKTGKEVWQASNCDSSKGYANTAAPRVGGGKVFIGNNCLDSGVERGHVDAFDAKTGAHLWRFYTMPGDPSKPFESKTMEMASKTWGTDYWKKTHGCVSPWDSMTYDEELNLLYIGTGSGAPWSPTARAPDAGDELFADSIVAVNATTGEYVWHYQTVQHDGWDLDATMPITIADLPINGEKRRVVMTAPKNGFFYVLDAKTGKFISAKNYVTVNWASRIDEKTGRPIYLPDARYWERPNETTVVAQGPLGAHNWMANSFDPITGLMYMPVLLAPFVMTPDPTARLAGMQLDWYYGNKGDPKWKSGGQLVAWDPIKQKARWRVEHKLPYNGGILSTAGNLVFQGTSVGTFDAYAADTGKRVWSFETHGSILAAPSTVEIDGEQIVLVASGNAGAAAGGPYVARYASTPASRGPSRLLAFKLGGAVTIPPNVVQEFPKPPLPRPPAALAKKGGLYFESEVCTGCHGVEAENARSSIPDLRLASAATHQQFAAIVMGARRDKGMPPYPNVSAEEITALQAYVLDQAWAAYLEQEARKAPSPVH